MKFEVLDRIEELRFQMQKIALDKDLTDPRVVKVSEKLDILINEFYSSQEAFKACRKTVIPSRMDHSINKLKKA